MTIGRPIGQSGFISSPIVSTEQAYQHCRPRGGERRDFRGTIPATAEQIERVADYDNHRVARAGAARASARRVITTEEVHTRAIATAAQEARSGQIDSPATLAHLAALQAALTAQQVVIDRLQARIDTIDSNQSIGDQS
jgi:hypothetical protein